MKLDQLLLGQIPEAIYFALFMMLVKNIKEKRILFTILMILEYVFLKCFLVYNIWFQAMYFILSFIMMKMLYRDKTQVTDIFTLGIASIILVITSAIPYVIIYFTIHNMLIYVILNRIIIFTLLFVFRYKLDGVKAQVEAKNDRIAELQTQLNMANLSASQTAQNAFISQGFSNEVDQLYNRLNSCPIPATPVYGRTPIFTCNNNGCGCNGFNTFA